MPNHVYNLKLSYLDGSEMKYEYERHLAQTLPEQVDLRPYCPPVYDQGNQGSCTANAGCAARSMLEGNPELYFSRAFQYYMERSLEGTTDEDAGASMKDVVLSLKRFGVCLDADMPYVPGDYKTPPTEQAKKNALQYKISGGELLNGLVAIQTALAIRRQPVLLGMKVFSSMESKLVAKTGVLPMPGSRDADLGGHAVLAVGYTPALTSLEGIAAQKAAKKSAKSPAGYLVVRNSWGPSWGDKGYFYMPYAYVEKEYAFEAWIMEK